MKTREEIERGLAQFHGSEQLHKLTLGPVLCTDGVRWLADAAECHWLVSVVSSYQGEPIIKDFDGFQVWRLDVKDGAGVVTARADKGQPVLITQVIEFTDFPLPSIDLWVVDGEPGQRVVMLPSEY
jgi:hypothetical protein